MKKRSSFYRRKAVPDGLYSWCKECCYAHERKIRRTKAYRRKRSVLRKALWRKNNATCRSEKRKYWREHRNQCREEQKRKYKRHRKKYLMAMRKNYYRNRKTMIKRVRSWKDAQFKSNPRKVLRLRREYHLKGKYGMTLGQYKALLKRQGGQCKICEKTKPGGFARRWHIDHDHKTGAIRGLLCARCNMALGLFGDDIFILQKAVQYLLAAKRLKKREKSA